jgi:hypothetical protein
VREERGVEGQEGREEEPGATEIIMRRRRKEICGKCLEDPEEELEVQLHVVS